MMGAVTLGGVLRAEHEVMNQAFSDWIGQTDKPGEDLQYLWGIHDMAEKLVKMMTEDETDG